MTMTTELPLLRFPDVIEGTGRVTLRRWTHADVEALGALVRDNLDHLRPFMPWVIAEPMPDEDRHLLVQKWDQDFDSGVRDAVYGVFVDDEPVGSTGFHRRVGPRGLEIGYWVDHRRLRQGIATELTSMLVSEAFSFPSVEFVEIHHDAANSASAGVPRKLGFVFAGNVNKAPQAEQDSGVDSCWRMTRDDWVRASDTEPVSD